MRASTCGRFAASSRAGITTLIDAAERVAVAWLIRLPAAKIAAVPAVESLTLIRYYLRGRAA